MWIATGAEIREIDRRARDEYGIPTASLMENAGRAVFDAAREMVSKGRIALVCGRGNNGGDGLVAARLLREMGLPLRCVVAGSEESLSPDASAQIARLRGMGVGPTLFGDEGPFDPAALDDCDLIVDALLGVGAKGEPRGSVREAIEAINARRTPVLAVDVPSGIDASSGLSLGAHVMATWTVTFGLPKPFLFQNDGLAASGRWTVADIGLPPELLGPTGALLLDRGLVADNLPRRDMRAHKSVTGRVLIVAGSERMPGAAIMCVRGALRAGAGLVTVASVRKVCEAVAAHAPEALLVPLPEEDGALAAGAAEAILELQLRCDAGVFGPGLSTADSVRECLSAVWPAWGRKALLDADALNAVAEGAGPLPQACALTPHVGEMARLLGRSALEVEADRFGAARAGSDTLGHPLILKGPGSVVSAPGLPLAVSPTGNPGMATGGMGDVLSGVVGTLMAQGMASYDALACGAYWHGLAGDLCAEEIGAIGYGPMELAERLPKARSAILA